MTGNLQSLHLNCHFDIFGDLSFLTLSHNINIALCMHLKSCRYVTQSDQMLFHLFYTLFMRRLIWTRSETSRKKKQRNLFDILLHLIYIYSISEEVYKAYKQINIIIICKYTLRLFSKEASYAHPWRIYLLKNTVILLNSFFLNNHFYFNIYYNAIYSCIDTLNFLHHYFNLQIILKCWFAAQKTLLIIINITTVMQLNIFMETVIHFF